MQLWFYNIYNTIVYVRPLLYVYLYTFSGGARHRGTVSIDRTPPTTIVSIVFLWFFFCSYIWPKTRFFFIIFIITIIHSGFAIFFYSYLFEFAIFFHIITHHVHAIFPAAAHHTYHHHTTLLSVAAAAAVAEESYSNRLVFAGCCRHS